jgi:hypothetical protein
VDEVQPVHGLQRLHERQGAPGHLLLGERALGERQALGERGARNVLQGEVGQAPRQGTGGVHLGHGGGANGAQHLHLMGQVGPR